MTAALGQDALRVQTTMCSPAMRMHTRHVQAASLAETIAHTMLQVVYKRYASLYFVAGIEAEDNELITLEVRQGHEQI